MYRQVSGRREGIRVLAVLLFWMGVISAGLATGCSTVSIAGPESGMGDADREIGREEWSLLLIIESTSDWAAVYFPEQVELIRGTSFMISEDTYGGIDPWGVYASQEYETAEQGRTALVGYLLTFFSGYPDLLDLRVEKGGIGSVSVHVGPAVDGDIGTAPPLQSFLWQGDKPGPHSHQDFTAVLLGDKLPDAGFRASFHQEMLTDLDFLAARWENVIVDHTTPIDVYWPEAVQMFWGEEGLESELAVTAIEQERALHVEHPDWFDYSALVFREPVKLTFNPALADAGSGRRYGYIITGEHQGNLFSDTLWFSERNGDWLIEEVLFKPFYDFDI